MKWLRWKRALFALLCSGFLLDGGCPNLMDLQKAASNAGQTFGSGIVTPFIKSVFNNILGTKV